MVEAVKPRLLPVETVKHCLKIDVAVQAAVRLPKYVVKIFVKSLKLKIPAPLAASRLQIGVDVVQPKAVYLNNVKYAILKMSL